MLKTTMLGLVIVSASMSFFAHGSEIIHKQFLPVDSDGDSVIDEVDECHETAVGANVDGRGCYINTRDIHKITLNIHFAFDSSVVKPEYFSEVKQVADFMQTHRLTRVLIEGHTDSDGTSAYNRALSHRRAQSVARVLVERYKIPMVRVTATGFGEDRPLVDNNTAQNKQKNRRVVAVIRAVRASRG